MQSEALKCFDKPENCPEAKVPKLQLSDGLVYI